MNTDEIYMNRCLELAKNGLGTTYPNPMVGSVIVHNGIIIGEGWHQKAGEPHAEVHAINSVKDKSLLATSTIYVSLEPCSHFGKTPPCCELIIKHQIPNVVIGTVDPNILVAGRGIASLFATFKNISVGVLEDECEALNKRFFTFHKKKRPYIILKWAECQNGFLAPETQTERAPVWITNPFSRQLVHQWRSQEQAILVGTNTAIADNPKLDVRDWAGNNPVRVVLDASNRIPKNSFVLDNKIKTIVFTANKTEDDLENLIYEVIDFDKNCAQQIMDILFKHQIQSVLIEGGKKTLQTFIDANMWDEAQIFKGEIALESGLKAPKIKYKKIQKTTIGNDTLYTILNYD